MKFSTFAISALTGATLAAPTPKKFTQPGGNHDYHNILEKRALGPTGIAVASVAASAVLGFIGGPVANRVLNDVFGVQKKRSVHYNLVDLTFDEARELYIENFVETLFEENPLGSETDAAVCAGTGYYISDPTATVDISALKFSHDGQEHEYDCFLLAGPVTVEVKNATDADFAFVAPSNATFENGVLTIV